MEDPVGNSQADGGEVGEVFLFFFGGEGGVFNFDCCFYQVLHEHCSSESAMMSCFGVFFVLLRLLRVLLDVKEVLEQHASRSLQGLTASTFIMVYRPACPKGSKKWGVGQTVR